jgi:hypothetical protein
MIYKRLLFSITYLILLSSSVFATVEYRYSYLPKKIYKNQLFPVTVLAMGISKSGKNIYFKFDKDSLDQPISNKPVIEENGKDSFYTFYFRANDTDEFKLPLLFIKSKDADIILDEEYISIVPLKSRDDFCGVISADMRIKTSQATIFDERNNLITLSIEAFEANIEDMRLQNYIQQGIEDIVRKKSKVKAEFYAVISSDETNLKFTYFNTIKEQYVFIDIPIKIRETTLSTQSEPNPKNDSFEHIKKMTLLIVSAMLFLLFLWKKDFFYLIITVILLIILLKFYTPLNKICIKDGARMRILPTQSSRISNTVIDSYETYKLATRGRFIKIEYNNGMIGWIDEDDICKN